MFAKACAWAAGVVLTGCGETASNPEGSAGVPESTSSVSSITTGVGGSTSSAGSVGGSSGGSQQSGTAVETFLHERRNDGAFCIGNDDHYGACVPVKVSVGSPLQILVELGAVICGGSGCARCIGGADIGCNATVSGNVIQLESWYTANVEIGPITCDLEHLAVAECELPPLAEGSYLIQHGDVQVELQVPTESVVVCGYPPPHDDRCCVSDAGCDVNEFCGDEFKCVQRMCESSVDCADGQVCVDNRCDLCSCPEGQTCGPNSTRCLRAEAVGPAYGACRADAECQGALEQCAGEVCQQQCASNDECAAPPSGSITPLCRLNGDAPGDCVLPCDNGGPECPVGMRCGDYGYCVW